ncbi:glycosyltransferase family 2 protein [Parvularcula oceani]|uniref:glycosyltransferase family 2 protein n=1 Tax=Parvularcula oceani TaxID=1247963 RepID=UPI0012DF0164|nr:glycosyltransferase family A protein [Parvularcula oceani]
MSPKISVLTIVQGRKPLLENLLQALRGQLMPPDEVVIAYMQPDPFELPDKLPFEVRICFAEDGHMPVADAWKRAAETATGDVLIYLDPDCIPAPSLVMAYALELQETDGCLIGDVLDLPGGAAEGADAAALERAGERPADRPAPPATGLSPEPDYDMFQGQTVALRRATLTRCAGPGALASGFGRQGADLARKLEAAGVQLYHCAGARAYRQLRSGGRTRLNRLGGTAALGRDGERTGDRPRRPAAGEAGAASVPKTRLYS